MIFQVRMYRAKYPMHPKHLPRFPALLRGICTPTLPALHPWCRSSAGTDRREAFYSEKSAVPLDHAHAFGRIGTLEFSV